MKLDAFVRSAGNYDVDEASDASGFRNVEPSLTKQAFFEDTDINALVARFGLGFEVPPGGVRMPQYGDYSGVVDFQTAMNAVAQARESFEELPPELRARFGNDPQRLLEFCADAANREEAVRLGLVDSPARGGSSPPAGEPGPAAGAAPVNPPAS